MSNIFLILLLFVSQSYTQQPCCPPTQVVTGTPNEGVFLQQRDRIDRNPSECPACDLCREACSVNNNRVCQNDCAGKTIYIPRSVGANTARELVGWQNYIHREDLCENYVSYAAALGYSRSFRPERLAQTLFGSTSINFAGSQVPDRRNCEWIADYFGLPTNFRGRIHLNPRIENIYLDNELFIGLNELACGLYARIHAPLVHSKWGLHITESCTTPTVLQNSFPACYMSGNSAPTTLILAQALSGNFVFGDMKTPRRFGNIDGKTRTRTRLADIDFILGYDFIQCPDYFFGLYAQLVAPTGNKPNIHVAFDPIVGNGHHWEIGFGVAGAALIWDCDETSLRIFFEGNVTHMCASNQLRSFDITGNRLFSRYMLLKQFERDGVTYSGNLISAINATTMPVSTSVPVKGDFSIKLSYSLADFQFDFGYNLYGHTKEKVCVKTDQLALSNVGIKGTEGTCYNVFATSGIPAEFGGLLSTQALNSTQSCATISHAGLVNNPQVPSTGPQTIATTWNNTRVTGPASGTDVIIAQTSQPPVLLTLRDVNICSGSACSFVTHKLFLFFGYTGCNGFAGFGGEIEFEALARNVRSSLNQWSLFIKGGLSY